MATLYDYRLAINHDNEAGYFQFTGALTSTGHIKPPICQGIQYADYANASDGTVYPRGQPYFAWEFNDLEKAEYDEILGYANLGWTIDLVHAECTVRTFIDRYTPTYGDYNCIVVHQKGVDSIYADHLYRTVRFLFKIVEST